MTRVCSRCKIEQLLDEFFLRSNGRHRASWCRSCSNAACSARYYAKKAAGTLPPSDKAQARNRSLLRRFGIGLTEYENMLMTQCGTCAVCGEMETVADPRTDQPPRLSVHHDHETGKVVALLCRACNTAIGHLKDSPALLRRAAMIHEGA